MLVSQSIGWFGAIFSGFLDFFQKLKFFWKFRNMHDEELKEIYLPTKFRNSDLKNEQKMPRNVNFRNLALSRGGTETSIFSKV